MIDETRKILHEPELKSNCNIGRIRRDDSLDNTFHVWCASDNLLKGAALNAVRIRNSNQFKGAR